jgi:hypothetical protein
MDARRLAASRMKADLAERDQAIQLLSLEYQTLREEMIMRMSSRFQFLGFTTTASALLATAVSHSPLGVGTWPVAALAAGVFLFGLACFLLLGRTVVDLSIRVTGIERRINDLLPVQPGTPGWLGWHSEPRHRSVIARMTYGELPWRS